MPTASRRSRKHTLLRCWLFFPLGFTIRQQRPASLGVEPRHRCRELQARLADIGRRVKVAFEGVGVVVACRHTTG